MVVTVNEKEVEGWQIKNIQKELASCKLPAKITLRAPQGLTELQFPVSMATPAGPVKQAAPAPAESQIEDMDDLVPKPLQMDSATSVKDTYSIVFLKRPL